MMQVHLRLIKDNFTNKNTLLRKGILFCEDIATNFRIVYIIFVLKIAAILCITEILSIMSLMEYSIEYAINDNR